MFSRALHPPPTSGAGGALAGQVVEVVRVDDELRADDAGAL